MIGREPVCSMWYGRWQEVLLKLGLLNTTSWFHLPAHRWRWAQLALTFLLENGKISNWSMVCGWWNTSKLAGEVVSFLFFLNGFWRSLLQGLRPRFCSKVLSGCWLEGGFPETLTKHTYLAQGLTMITKVVSPGRGCSIALRCSWPLRLPQMWVTRVHNFC